MAKRVDILIVGAGIQGAAAAYSASLRGHSVLVVDRGDFGAGASSNSLKIAHGGLRYLQSLDLPRYFESIRERRRWMRLAPSYVRPQPFRLDVGGRSLGYRMALACGLGLNELASMHRNRGVRPELRLPSAAYPGWYDAVIHDTERVLLDLLFAARSHRPDAVELRNYAPLESLLHRNGKLVGAVIRGVGEVHAKTVLCCMGVAAGSRDAVLAMNLIVDPVVLGTGDVAVGLQHADDGRNLFVVPWRGRSMIGTYYRSYPFDRRQPLRFRSVWLDECLRWARAAHPQLHALSRRHVRFVHAGLLPQASSDSVAPADRPLLCSEPDGTLVVQTVKWTTAFGVAERAIDRIGSGEVQPTRRPRRRRAVGSLGTDSEAVPYRPPVDVGALSEGKLLTRELLEHVVRFELARTLEDVLLRRTGIASAGHPGVSFVEAVAIQLQPLLEWTDAERREQIERFHASFHFAGSIPNADP